jgi:DNA-binding beta-propeller fold protein YncE
LVVFSEEWEPMKRKMLAGIVPVGIVLVGLVVIVPGMGRPVFGQAASGQAPHAGEGGVPIFEKDPAWPKVPAKWKLGSVSSAAVDAQDHVWIIHRPLSLPADQRAEAAPPVLEFDNAGNFIQAWGGEGAGYEWVLNEHSVHVDYKGFVWILGSDKRDGQILKFTKAGKLVMQIGHRDQTGDSNSQYLKEPTGLWVYPKTNELFVSDGYGNRRVIVFDADTGEYKRHWGAYGNKPVDIGPRAGRDSQQIRFFPKDPWRAYAENLQQFDNPHDVKVSNDGFVYVADRGNKRIQVFTVDGKYVTQQFVGVDSVKYLQKTPACPSPPCHEPDIESRSVAFSPDPQQKFLYVAGLPDVYILNRKTLEILGSFATGTVEAHPPNHEIAADGKGNIYTPQAGLAGTGSETGPIQKWVSSGTAEIQKWVLKGYSPVTPCPPCQSSRSVSE